MREYIMLVAKVSPEFEQTVIGVVVGTIKQISFK